MSRRTNLLRHTSIEPSYFSRLSRGVVASSAFERRYIPGVVGTNEHGAVILPFAPIADKVSDPDRSQADKASERSEIT